MKTKNTKFLDVAKNREYYIKSDGNFMPLTSSLYAHRVLKRVDWVRGHVLKLDARTHLDVGCKDGYTALTLTADGIDCVAIDPSADAIEAAKEKAREVDYDVTYITTMLEDYKTFHKFDTVSMMEVLEHVTDAEVVVEKLAKLGRFVLITTPDAFGQFGTKDAERNEEHVRLFTLGELEELCAKYGIIQEAVAVEGELYIIFQSNL